MATMNISLPDKLKKWVEKQVKAGSYSNTSDYMRELVRKQKEREEVFAELQALIDEGEASGYRPFDKEAFKTELRLRASTKDAA